jgi:hypothetical protein
MTDFVESTMENTVDTVGKTVNNLSSTVAKTIDSTFKIDELLGNKYLYAGLAIALAMYGPRLQPKLPLGVRNLFNNAIFRFAVIVLIMYLGNKNLQLSLIIAIAFCLTISLVNSQMAAERFEDMAHENFMNMTMNEGFYDEEESDEFDCNKCNTQCNFTKKAGPVDPPASKDVKKDPTKPASKDVESTGTTGGGGGSERFMNVPPSQQLSYIENNVRQVTEQYKRV